MDLKSRRRFTSGNVWKSTQYKFTQGRKDASFIGQNHPMGSGPRGKKKETKEESSWASVGCFHAPLLPKSGCTVTSYLSSHPLCLLCHKELYPLKSCVKVSSEVTVVRYLGASTRKATKTLESLFCILEVALYVWWHHHCRYFESQSGGHTQVLTDNRWNNPVLSIGILKASATACKRKCWCSTRMPQLQKEKVVHSLMASDCRCCN